MLFLISTIELSVFLSFSDEDDEEPLDWLPIAPEIEDPEEQGWGQLEVLLAG